MSCSLPQSEASGGAPLRRSRRLTEVGVTRGCLYGTSHLCPQSTRRHIGLHQPFFDGKGFLGGNCSGGSPMRSAARPTLILAVACWLSGIGTPAHAGSHPTSLLPMGGQGPGLLPQWAEFRCEKQPG